MMSIKVGSSSPSCCYICHGRPSKTQASLLLPRARRIDKTRDFFKLISTKHGISTAISKGGNFQGKASSSPTNPSSSWKKWLVGIFLTVILPGLGYKGGLLLSLKS